MRCRRGGGLFRNISAQSTAFFHWHEMSGLEHLTHTHAHARTHTHTSLPLVINPTLTQTVNMPTYTESRISRISVWFKIRLSSVNSFSCTSCIKAVKKSIKISYKLTSFNCIIIIVVVQSMSYGCTQNLYQHK